MLTNHFTFFVERLRGKYMRDENMIVLTMTKCLNIHSLFVLPKFSFILKEFHGRLVFSIHMKSYLLFFYSFII